LGYRERRNFTIEARWADGHTHLPRLARGLVELNADVICTAGTPATLAAKQATTTIPIVFGRAAFPERTGLVTSLARPGGNLNRRHVHRARVWQAAGTPSGGVGESLAGRIALQRPEHRQCAGHERNSRVGQDVQVAIEPFGVHDRVSLETAFGAIRRGNPDALMTTADPLLASYRTPIVEFASGRRLLLMYGDRDYVVAGGLMFYGTSLTDMWRHAAIYVDRILRGAKPGELPVEQPKKFELLINMKAAKSLGLTIPATLLIRADQVIE
jgi:ABC-type uncharacterized transport system substrate-binding protein